jgi:hypothetical protein
MKFQHLIGRSRIAVFIGIVFVCAVRCRGTGEVEEGSIKISMNPKAFDAKHQVDTIWNQGLRKLGVGEKRKMFSKVESMGKIVKGEINEENEPMDRPSVGMTKEKSKLSKEGKVDVKGIGPEKKNKNETTKNSDTPSLYPISSPIDASKSPSVSPNTKPNVPVAPPMMEISVSPTKPSLPLQQIVRLEDYYMSFVAPDATRSPTEEEYSEMLVNITNYFETYLKDYFITNNNETISLVRIVTSNDFNLYGTSTPGLPDSRYNIYMNFNYTDFMYTPGTENPPNAEETFSILLLSITPDFIINIVRTFVFTPFESTNEVFCGESNFTNGPPSS